MSGLTQLAARLQHDWWQPRLTALTALLWPLSILFALLTGLDRLTWQLGWRRAHRLPVPVLVVGNLIVGGAGKTPTTIALVQWLQRQGRHPGVVSRGYGRSTDDLCLVQTDTCAQQCGDEPLLMHLRTGAPVVVHRLRAQAARHLLAKHPEVDVILADDGLQHHALVRDFSLIVFDRRGQGNGHLLPAGPLRQRLPDRLPPLTWVLYNAASPSTNLPGACAHSRLSGAVRLTDWWQGRTAEVGSLDRLARQSENHPFLAVAGIGEPERFFSQLEQTGIQLLRHPLPDHANLLTHPWPAEPRDLLLTEKDAVKLRPQDAPPGRTVWVVTLDFQLPDALTDAIGLALPSIDRMTP